MHFPAKCATLVEKGVIELLEEVEVLRVSERGQVTLLRDSETGKRYVRKKLQGDVPVYQRLQSLRHPYLPLIEAVHQEDGKTVVLEEYIDGADLSRLTLSQRQLTKLLLELCDVLEFLHGQGILHRDIKPSNLMLASDGHLRLIDFDAAREAQGEGEQDTRLLGTRGYAPPEQYGFAQTDARADIYAMGVTFRQLLGPLARKKRWKRLLRKCTALDPKDRYHSAAQVRRAVWRGRAKRWLLHPILALLGLRLLVYLALIGYGFATNAELRDLFHDIFFEMEWFERPRIFASVDVEQLKTEETLARRYQGKVAPFAQAAQNAYPDRGIIYTGYLSPSDRLLFGVFEVTYNYATGEYRYESFLGLCDVGKDGAVSELITPRDCEAVPEIYGAPVLRLYDMDVFDTPFF